MSSPPLLPLCGIVLIVGTIRGQSAPPVPTATPKPADPPLVTYRGFSPGIAYRDLLLRAQTLAEPGALPLVCNTSRHTAQLIECGGYIRDPADSARFYLSAHVIAGRVDFISFGDSGTATLVERRQQELTNRFGAPHRIKNGLWEWKPPASAQVVRFAWRGLGEARWIYVSLWDPSVMNGIQSFVPSRTP